MSQYTDAAAAYCADVVNGQIPACKWTRLAAERQLADLRRPLSDEWPYVFDEQAASRVCQFIELLPHIKGKWAREGRLIKLEPWQCFIVTTVFGWLHHATGLRRYREVYIEVPRKNGKSAISSGVALYMLAFDGEHGAEVYSAATTKEQARIVFDDASAMASRTDMGAAFGVVVQRHIITVADTASKFLPLAAEASTQDGLNIHFAVLDELHAHKKRELYDVLDTARGAREQSILWSITTAGDNRAGICYERRSHVTKILQNTVSDPAIFGVIYTTDDNDDPFVPTSWAKANPNWGVSVLVDDMTAAARKAEAMPSALNNFLTKRLNVWVNGGSPWMDMKAWDRCAHADLQNIEEFAGAKVWMGLDLAQKKDFAALTIAFEHDFETSTGTVFDPTKQADDPAFFQRQNAVERKWCVCTRLYLNELAIQESGNAHLSGWARQGYVNVTDGDLTDFDVVADDMRRFCRLFDVQEIAFDPALSMYFASKLIEEGLPLVEITQRALFFTPALLQVENMVLEGNLRHDGNPVMTWMVSNLVVKVSKFNELRAPTKDRPENKIDGPMAMLMALGRALANKPDEDNRSKKNWESFAAT